jgi:Spy/CpxP family protein refolding chaperone
MMNGNKGGMWMLAGLVALCAGSAAVGAAAEASHGAVLAAMHSMGGHDMEAAGPAAMDARFDEHVAKMVPDATAEQKERLKAIVGAIHADMGAIHAQMGDTHRRAHALLLAPVIDRAALENLRVEQLRAFDASSKRLLTSFEDAASVLTPEQRQRFAAQMAAHPH